MKANSPDLAESRTDNRTGWSLGVGVSSLSSVKSRDVQRAYSSLAQLYIDRLGSVEIVHPEDRLFIERRLGHLQGPILDVGCGPGHLTGFLHSVGSDVTGIDLVPDFIAHARETYPEAHFQVGSLAEMVRPDASVAGLLAWYSLIHLDPDQLDDALTAIRRVVAPGGALVVGFFKGWVCEPFQHKVITAYRWPVDEMVGRLALAGFEEVERMQREPEGERRPHAAIAARAV